MISQKNVESILLAIPPENFIDACHTHEKSNEIRRQLERLEKDLVSEQVETSKLDHGYSENTHKSVIIKSPLERILNRSNILHWFYDNHPDYLSVFKQFTAIDNLNQINEN